MNAAVPIFFGRVESLRGLAAGIVAFGHVLGIFAPVAQSLPEFRLLRTFAQGDNAVLMFFVISGFVLFFSLERYRNAEHPIARFLIARVFRIYPAAIVTVLIVVVLVAITARPFQGQTSIDLVMVLKNMLLLDTNINGVMWTLKIELLAAPIIVAAYFAYRRFGIGFLWALLAVFTALSFVRSFNTMANTATLGLHAFIFGMILAAAGQNWCENLSRSGATALFVIATFGFFASAPVLGWASHWKTLFAIGFAGIMIVLAAFKDVGPGLASRTARFLGKISYGFYLLHPLALFALEQPEIQNTISRLVVSGMSPSLVLLLTFLLSVLVIIPLAYLLLLTVEYPGIALGQRVIRHRLAPAIG